MDKSDSTVLKYLLFWLLCQKSKKLILLGKSIGRVWIRVKLIRLRNAAIESLFDQKNKNTA